MAGAARNEPVDSFVIEILERDRRPRRITITATVEIGRECNGVLLNDDQVSRRHAAFTPGPDGLTLTDLGSTNGTLVNGRRVTRPEIIGPGDDVRVGDTTVRVLERHGAPEPSPQAPPPQLTAVLDTPTLGEVALLVRGTELVPLTQSLGAPGAVALLEWALATVRHYAGTAAGTAGSSLETGVSVVFPSALPAVDCALRVLDAVAQRNASSPPPPLVLTCAVEASITPEHQRYGSPTAAAAHAAPGSVVVSAGVATALSGRPDLVISPVGTGPRSTDGAGYSVQRR